MSRMALTLYVHVNSDHKATFRLDGLGKDPMADTLTLDVEDSTGQEVSLFLTRSQVRDLVAAIAEWQDHDPRSPWTIWVGTKEAAQRARKAQDATGAISSTDGLT